MLNVMLFLKEHYFIGCGEHHNDNYNDTDNDNDSDNETDNRHILV